MGTSAPADPLKGAHPLIPSWVPDGNVPPTDVGPAGTPTADTDTATSSPADGAVADTSAVFLRPRSRVSSAIRITSTGGGATAGRGSVPGRRSRRPPPTTAGHLRKAVSQYIAARGGPGGVTRRLGVAVDVGARLYQALERIARNGLDAALQQLGLQLNERSAGAVADALITLVCEESVPNIAGVLDESLARAACDETLIALYQQGVTLATLTPEQVPAVIQSFAVNAACLLITREIATTIIDRPRTEAQVQTLQSTLRSVIESSMRMQLPAPRASDYTVQEIRSAVAEAYQNAFQILRATT
jgi:hypothetical protein